MIARPLLVQKIRSYLEALSPRAVDMLMRNLEESRTRGATDPMIRLIIEAGMEMLRSDETALNGEPRAKWLRRLYFRPVEPLLIDEALPHKQRGRITRSSLPGIWSFIERDIAPEVIAEREQKVLDPSIDEAEAVKIVAEARAEITPLLRHFLLETRQDEKLRRRIAMLVGGERAFLDMHDVIEVFEAESWLAPLLEGLPEKLTDWDMKIDSPAAMRVKKAADDHMENSAVLAAAVLQRTENPACLASLATQMAGTGDARKLAASPYSAFVDIVLSEAERLYLIAQKKNEQSDMADALTRYHTLIRNIDRDVDFSCGGAWHKRLAETKRQFSTLVSSELEAAVSHVRKALKIPALDTDGAPRIDQLAVGDAKRSLQTLLLMRRAAESLAVNEVTARTRQAVEQTLEIMTRKLLADSAKCAEGERPAFLAAVDVAIDLCDGYFGKDYADLLRRSRKAAAGGSVEAAGPAAAQAGKQARDRA